MTDTITKEPKTIKLSTLIHISAGILIGVIASNNLDVEYGSELETATNYVKAPFYMDSTELARIEE